ncbi:unnamed protein product [Adineta ricciae]|uniref:F-box domain-containing protein n=1 Tax=Adineta ricciae TaxID=249248 RepID=A0A815WFI7_ADIRI|nr:unnamed protein product [Adineta ricciae]
MEHFNITLNDLPDEILLIILKNLKSFDIHFSLQGVNQRLNQIIQEEIFTNRLSFIKRSSDNFIDRLSDKTILDRFCLQILPSIHYKIQYLALGSTSMKSVLQANYYPNLYSLALFNVDKKSFKSLLKNKILSTGIFRTQITTLNLSFDQCENFFDMFSSIANIFQRIFPTFSKLKYLILDSRWYYNCVRLNSDESSFIHNFRSSTLLYLDIKVQSYNDCLYILDGRFNQLHTLIIDVVNPFDTYDVQNRDNLPNLKHFSFTCNYETYFYNETIPPLLNRMSNLERLGLYIGIDSKTTFIDGHFLKHNILNSLRKLNDFQFSIISYLSNVMQLNLPSTKDIEQTFTHFKSKHIISCVEYFPESKKGQYHIYSYPSKMTHYNDITNKFPGGIFEHVRTVSLFDEKPFEHEFFLQIQKSFPFMEDVCIRNSKPQNRKEFNENLSPIQYSFLRVLRICNVHDDYIKQFLTDTKNE